MKTITIDESWRWVFADCSAKTPQEEFIEYLHVICAIVIDYRREEQKIQPSLDLNQAIEKFSATLSSSSDVSGLHGMDLIRAAYARKSLPVELINLLTAAKIEKINGLPDYVNLQLKARQIFICDTEYRGLSIKDNH